MSEELNKLKQEIIAEAINPNISSKEAKEKLLSVLLDTLIIKSKSEALDEVKNNKL